MNDQNTAEILGGPTPLRRATLGLVVMFLGGSGLVYEYCLSTLATHLVGNSIERPFEDALDRHPEAAGAPPPKSRHPFAPKPAAPKGD